jgi:predicted DNA-binding transcriptional regulator AlpA
VSIFSVQTGAVPDKSLLTPARQEGAAAMTKPDRNRRDDGDWPELLTVKEAAKFLRLTRSTLDHYRCDGRGPIYRKHGARVFYPKPELIAWSERNAYASTSEKIRKTK